MVKNRNITFDVVRSICMLWIVGFWHIADYVGFNKSLDNWGGYITGCTLACFCFISGFFLGTKRISPTEFYISRFKRFYILFFFAGLTMYLGGWIKGFSQFIFSMTGLSCFILPQPKTLWFFSMMIIFYALTPVILYKTSINPKKCILEKTIRSLFFVCLFILISYFFEIDIRLPRYFVFYCIGLIIPHSKLELGLRYKYYIFIISLIILLIIKPNKFESDYLKVSGYIVGILFLLSLSEIIKSANVKFVNYSFIILSYASMCTYLFHRHILKLFCLIINQEYHHVYSYWWAVMLIVTILISYYIQLIYDKYLMKKINIKIDNHEKK